MKFQGPELVFIFLAVATGEPFWLWMTILFQALED